MLQAALASKSTTGDLSEAENKKDRTKRSEAKAFHFQILTIDKLLGVQTT